MKAIWRTLLLAMLICGQLTAGNLDSFFSNANTFFSKYVHHGLVDYQSIQKNDKELSSLLNAIAKADMDQLSESELKAFYINSYNLFVIDNILKYYPISSPLSEKGFFNDDAFMMGGKEITLNDLENKVIRPVYKDARFHFVLVCGAKGCPPLISEAYMPANVEQLLDQQTKAAFNDKMFTRVGAHQVELSEILKWYREDFGSTDAEIINYINGFRNQKLNSTSKLSYYQYNWETNEK